MGRTVPLQQSRGPIVRIDPATRHLTERHYLLEVLRGPDAGTRVALDAPLIAGTDGEAGLVLKDPTVSGEHLELSPRADGVRVRDLGSTNGTFVGGARVQELLAEGETVVTIGKTVLRITMTEEDRGTPVGATGFGRVLGKSAAMRRVFGLLENVAKSDSTVVLLGETGTGKELLAEAIHQASPRRDRPMVVVDCGAIPASLVGSELFGHVKGAFTGATSDRAGAFIEANGGTVFLDEIGELPLEIQPLLLRVLEAGTVKRVGDDRQRRVDVRVIAATHRDLEAAVKAGTFRRDLFFRLAVAIVEIPPLRERLEDLPLLIEHFVTQLGRPDFGVSEKILERFAAYEWPGNLRELRNLVERALLGADVPGPKPTAAGNPPGGPGVRTDLPFKEAKEKLVDAFTREYLETLLARCDGNVSRAARESGLTRTYLHELIGRYGLAATDG